MTVSQNPLPDLMTSSPPLPWLMPRHRDAPVPEAPAMPTGESEETEDQMSWPRVFPGL